MSYLIIQALSSASVTAEGGCLVVVLLLSCCCLIEGVGFQSARESEERRSHRVGSRVAFVQTQQMGQ